LSSLFTLGVLPMALLWVTTGFSIWTTYSLFWLLIALSYVLIVIVRFQGAEKARILLHAGLRMGYALLIAILFFGLAIPFLGAVALIFPLFPDSANQWFIAPKTRRYIVLRVPVYILIIAILLWINSRL
jgi:hypothetical protein